MDNSSKPLSRRLFPWAGSGQRKTKRVYMFSEGSSADTNLLGLKGSNLCDIFRMELPVPPGFIITSDAARDFVQSENIKESEKIIDEYRRSIKELERQTGKKFGGGFDQSTTTGVTLSAGVSSVSISREQKKEQMSLLLSVRASPAIHMPGVMDAILNIGINEELTVKLAQASDNPRWALDTYRRFLQLFGTTVYGIDDKKYKLILANERMRCGVAHDSDLGPTELQNVISEFKRLANVPQDPWEQLHVAINSIYKSWFSFKADKYREIYGVTEDLGVAIIVQSMVFGNLSGRCGVGTAYTRNPNSGEREFIAEFATCTCGEDIFGGSSEVKTLDNLRDEQAGLYSNLVHVLRLLERHYRDMQEIEFTVEEGTLFVLQAASATRSSQAAINVAVSMVKEKLISEREALMRLDPVQMMHCILPVLAPEIRDSRNKEAFKALIGKGLPASVGTATGKIVFSTQEAISCRMKNQTCILCLYDASTDDIEGLEAASGLLTVRGGISSHASIWMRGSGKPSVTCVQNIGIDPKARQLLFVDTGGKVTEGDDITIDGTNGLVFFGQCPTIAAKQEEEYLTLLNWARKYKVMNVLANADSVDSVNEAFSFGADGIGIFRTESMFLASGRLELTRFILLTDNESERAAALTRLLELQRDDLVNVFRAVGDRDVVLRMLDVSLQSAMPISADSNYSKIVENLCSDLNISKEECEKRINALLEPNPLLGVRGCRLAFIQPYFASMQARAIARRYFKNFDEKSCDVQLIEATLIVRREGCKVNTKILLPIAFSDREVDRILPLVTEAIAETCAQQVVVSDFKDFKLDIEFGVDIANPRACLKADKFGRNKNLGFMSIDTDSLTELVFGITKEQSTRYIPLYVDKQVVSRDPFSCIDATGVGRLIEMAVDSSRKQRDDLKVNISGHHTADPLSVRFFNAIGVDTLTVADNNLLPVATVAAAQSTIQPQQMRVNRFANPTKL